MSDLVFFTSKRLKSKPKFGPKTIALDGGANVKRESIMNCTRFELPSKPEDAHTVIMVDHVNGLQQDFNVLILE
jgi:hypothetical protein